MFTPEETGLLQRRDHPWPLLVQSSELMECARGFETVRLGKSESCCKSIFGTPSQQCEIQDSKMEMNLNTSPYETCSSLSLTFYPISPLTLICSLLFLDLRRFIECHRATLRSMRTQEDGPEIGP